MQAVGMAGLSYPTVRNVIDRFEEGGWSAIHPTFRGHDRGDGRVLNPAQEENIQRLSIGKRPEQLKMEFRLRNRAAVGLLIEQKFGMRLQVRSIGKYLARRDFTPQKPIKRACEQRPEAVQQWRQQEYSAIEQRARKEGAAIYWGDETALVNIDVCGRNSIPASQTSAAMTVGGTSHKLSMTATVTNQGKARWKIIDEAFDVDKLVESVQALIHDAHRKVFLILDNLRVLHSKRVKAWAQEHKDPIELRYLPNYSPELNPEERLNVDLKQEMGKRVPIRTKGKLRHAANEHMTMLERTHERVMCYFQDHRMRHAATA